MDLKSGNYPALEPFGTGNSGTARQGVILSA
jgi:hypothetical protein